MDETMNNFTWNNTASTTDSATLTFNTDSMTNMWVPYYTESTWMPYYYEKYFPAYHLLKSYGISKNQHRSFGVARFWEKLKKLTN